MNPAIIRRSVVLPHPDGPRRKKRSPELICRSTPATAVVVPYFFTIPLSKIEVITSSVPHPAHNPGVLAVACGLPVDNGGGGSTSSDPTADE
jgi:hypothetical protein